MSGPVNVLAVIQRRINVLGKVGAPNSRREITRENLVEAHSYVAELIEANRIMREALTAISDEFGNAKPNKAVMGMFANNALANIGSYA